MVYFFSHGVIRKLRNTIWNFRTPTRPDPPPDPHNNLIPLALFPGTVFPNLYCSKVLLHTVASNIQFPVAGSPSDDIPTTGTLKGITLCYVWKYGDFICNSLIVVSCVLIPVYIFVICTHEIVPLAFSYVILPFYYVLNLLRLSSVYPSIHQKFNLL